MPVMQNKLPISKLMADRRAGHRFQRPLSVSAVQAGSAHSIATFSRSRWRETGPGEHAQDRSSTRGSSTATTTTSTATLPLRLIEELSRVQKWRRGEQKDEEQSASDGCFAERVHGGRIRSIGFVRKQRRGKWPFL